MFSQRELLTPPGYDESPTQDAVVLQAAVDVIGIGVVDAHVIELRNRQVDLVLPARAAVFAAPEAAVVAGITLLVLLGSIHTS